MGRDGVDILMAQSIKVCGGMDSLMGRELNDCLMNLCMKVCGRMVNVMVQALKRLKTALCIKEHGMKEDLSWVNAFILIKSCMKETGWKVNLMAMA